MGNRWGNSGYSVRLYFLGCKITVDGDCSHEIKRCLLLGRKVMINLDSILKSRDITLPTKAHLVKAESPLDYKEIQPIHSKGDQSWVFFGRNDAKAETPVVWPPHVKSWLIGKDSDPGKGCGQEEKGTQRMRCLDSITDLMEVSLSWWWTGSSGVL